MDDPRQTNPLSDDQINTVADASAPGSVPPVAARLAAVVHTMRTQAIQPAPESLVQRLVRLQAQPGLIHGIDRVADAVAGALLGAVRSIVATLTYDSRVSPALAGFRGSASTTLLSFSCEMGEIHLQVTESGSSPDARVTVRGVFEPLPEFVVSPDSSEPSRVVLSPLAGGESVAADLDDDSMFVMRLSPGAYRAALRTGDVAIDLGPVELP